MLPVCIKYAAQDESRVENIAQGEAECYICPKTLIKSCMVSYKRNGSVLVLLKALPRVCMKYTARDESRVANIARGKAECYICHKTLIKSCILLYKRSGSVLSVLLYFTLI